MGRPSNTEARRAEIVEAMVRVMAERGYDKASTAAIAKEAGLTAGLVHYHFRSKEAVLLALVQRVAATARERFERLAEGAGDPSARLHAFIDAHLAEGPGADPDAVACWVALGTQALAAPSVRSAYVEVVEAQLGALVGLVADALVMEGRSRAAARRRAPRIAAGLLAAIEGAFRLATVAPGAIPAGSMAATVRHMADGALAAERPR